MEVALRQVGSESATDGVVYARAVGSSLEERLQLLQARLDVQEDRRRKLLRRKTELREQLAVVMGR